jgi:hypothetical protein
MQLAFLSEKRERETHQKGTSISLRAREREREELHDYNLIERGPFLNNLVNCLGVEDG